MLVSELYVERIQVQTEEFITRKLSSYTSTGAHHCRQNVLQTTRLNPAEVSALHTLECLCNGWPTSSYELQPLIWSIMLLVDIKWTIEQ
jgi:hypothetical protein